MKEKISKTELTLIIPTYNEKGNIPTLVERIRSVLNKESYTILFVDDDSSDGTLDVIRSLTETNQNIELIHRVGRKGLSSACIDGMAAAMSPYVAVMDADLQHDETILPYMLAAIKNENLDLVIGSRYVSGGSVGNWKLSRKITSTVAVWMSKPVLSYGIKDPMSGFFMCKRSFFESVKSELHGGGFKILLDMVVSSKKEVNFKEIPFTFRTRHAGESKLGADVVWEYIKFLWDKKFKKA